MSSTEGPVIEPLLEIGIDAFGDPFVRITITTPDGAALSADACEQIGLKILAAAAAARARAGAVRTLMLEGRSPGQAVNLVDHLMKP